MLVTSQTAALFPLSTALAPGVVEGRVWAIRAAKTGSVHYILLALWGLRICSKKSLLAEIVLLEFCLRSVLAVSSRWQSRKMLGVQPVVNREKSDSKNRCLM